LWRGLLYHPDSRQAAWALVRDWSFEERLDLYRRTPREGLRARIRNTTLQALCQELVAIGKNGLHRLGSTEGAAMLAPLEEVAATGRTQADRIVELHAQHHGDPAKLIAALKLSA
jgi:glutamate--cysteine ligase